MKLNKKAQATIVPRNAEMLGTWANKKLLDTPYFALLRVLAEGLDLAAKGQNCYFILGTTQQKNAVSLTIRLEEDRDARYGDGLLEMSQACSDLL